MASEALGRILDVALGSVPVDTSAAATTGKRVSLTDCAGVTVVVVKAAGGSGESPTLTLKQHTVSTGGSPVNLAIIDHYYLKSATTLAGTEQWTKVTQAAAATITDPGAAGTSGQSQQIIAFEVPATSLSDTYKYISVDQADVGSTAQYATVLYIRRDLKVARSPEKLAASLA